jgi:hypothetical protein
MNQPYCAVCDRDHQGDPTLVLAHWRDQDICTDCLEHRPGKEEAEAEARGKPGPMTQQQYREDGGEGCPTCHEYGFTVIDTTGEQGSLYQVVRGSVCHHQWTMVYRLGGFIREDGAHEDEDLEAIQDVIAVNTSDGRRMP